MLASPAAARDSCAKFDLTGRHNSLLHHLRSLNPTIAHCNMRFT
jgi:hypothetical protein